ncbi:MAG: thioredoxin TrxA [Pseudomonadota bacterium]
MRMGHDRGVGVVCADWMPTHAPVMRRTGQKSGGVYGCAMLHHSDAEGFVTESASYVIGKRGLSSFNGPATQDPPPLIPLEPTMSIDLIKHISDSSFDGDVLKADKPVLVDYWAEWCGPCKMIAPILDDVAKTYEGRLQIAKMNVDENRDVPAKFGIRGIPTLMLFKSGQLAATKVGALSKPQLVAFLNENL